MRKPINFILFQFWGFLAVGFVIWTSVENTGFKNYIWIEAESAEAIHSPLKIIDMEGASENRGVISSGGHHVTNGFAVYSFEVKQAGEYYLWGRCYWPHVCANSFLFSIDDSEQYEIGENPMVNQWHWVLASSFNLTRGVHKLRLWNREMHSMIDKYLLSADPYFVPSGTGNLKNYYLDFNEKSSLDLLSLKDKRNWSVMNEKERFNSVLFLSEVKNNDNEIFLLPVDGLASYVFRFAYKTLEGKNNNLKVYFNYTDELNNHFLCLEGNRAAVFMVENGSEKMIDSVTSEDLFAQQKYSDIAFNKTDQEVKIKLNGRLLFRLAGSTLTGNYVGVGSSSGNFYFDNVSLISEEQPEFNENFHYTGFNTTNIRPEISPDYFESLRNGTTNGWVISGNWKVYERGFETLKGRRTGKLPGIIIFGSDFWKNYSFKTALKFSKGNGAGIIFNFQDKSNYCLFKWEKENTEWYQSIIQFQNGEKCILARKKTDSPQKEFGDWYCWEVLTNGDSITCFIDNQLVFSLREKEFEEGKVGLWTNSQKDVEFDDIHLSAANNPYPDPQEQLRYQFRVNQQISLDMSDWVFSPQEFFQPNMKLSKDLFESSYMYNKRWFKNDLHLLCHFADIPYDVEVNLLLTGFYEGIERQYEFIIGHDHFSITKNGRMEKYQKTLGIARQKVELSHIGKKWELKAGKETLLFDDISEKSNLDSIKVGIGFSGIGVVQTRMPYIFMNTNTEQLLSHDSHEK